MNSTEDILIDFKNDSDKEKLLIYLIHRKKVGLCYFLAIFLGQLGMHRFYLGYTNSGALQLISSIIFFRLYFVSYADTEWFFGIAFIVSGIFSLRWIVDLFLIPSMTKRKNLNKIIELGFDPKTINLNLGF
jgi:TM2 domain-containing membrane protein YozV